MLLVGCCLSCLFFFAFFGGDAKSLAWVFLARRVLPFVFGFFFAAFFGGDAKSLAWVFLARRVLTKWMVMGSVYLELFETKPCCILCALLSLTCYRTPFCSPKMSKICQDFPCLAKCCLAFFGGDAKSLAWVFLARQSPGAAFRVCQDFFPLFLPFLGAMPNPSLGCFLLVGCCLSCLFFFLPFLRCQIPGVSFLLVGCCLSCLGSFVAFFGGDAKSLAWVFLARRVLPFVFGFNMIGYTAI